ncbi:flagellar biosynthesis repressor FlbT [Roseibium aggregatum]|uniref:Flagellar biosynthesis repressor FlbT n=1 Tax=Roseibium aggregatum TaxID=187304 RepID=A0A926NUX6_9HYPH|nr:flagellar biosynthesis repressor FlbT [Roseibium aggregatum]MBD1545699.1 flagellar biosynthesis repressor FlbT [Roseibium aggregatum]
MKIGLKAGERLFVNGAVLRVERKTNLELMNDAVFLLENHVLQPEDATTPLRQLYFVLQTMVMDPVAAPSVQGLFEMMMRSAKAVFSNPHILESLKEVKTMNEQSRWFEAMKIVRSLYPTEAALMSGGEAEIEQVVRLACA